MPCCRFAAVGDCLEIWRVWSLLALVVRVSLSVFFLCAVCLVSVLFVYGSWYIVFCFFSLLVIFSLLDIPGLSFFSPPSCYSFLYKTVEDCPKNAFLILKNKFIKHNFRKKRYEDPKISLKFCRTFPF